jgi:hypothetical protein
MGDPWTDDYCGHCRQPIEINGSDGPELTISDNEPLTIEAIEHHEQENISGQSVTKMGSLE